MSTSSIPVITQVFIDQRDQFALQADDLQAELQQIFLALGVNNFDEALTCIETMQHELGVTL